jgi:colanic acid biosynthesis glycosyl transferase WcaI
MRVLLLTQYFPPEVGAAPERLGYLAKYLAGRGHQVKVLTCRPNYPQGQLYGGYKNPFWKVTGERDEHGIEMLRAWVYLTKGHRSFAYRLVYFLSLAFSALLALRRVGQVDVVLVETPPIFLSFTASLYALLKRARKVVYYSDPWVSFAAEWGYLKKDSLTTRMAFWLERQSLSRSDLIITPNPGVRAHCIAVHRIRPEKVKLVMNGVDVDFYRPDAEARERERRARGFEDKFVVIFAGTYQHQAGLDVLVRAAARLRTLAPDVNFLLLGGGVDKPRIAELAREAGVLDRNFFMRDTIPAVQARDLLNACDVGTNPLAAGEITNLTLSVKLLTYMGCGLPVLIADRQTQREIVEAAGCGVACAPGDDQAWAEKILWLRDHPQERREMAERARRAAVERFSRRSLAQELEMALSALAPRQVPERQCVTVKTGEVTNG